MDSNTLPENIRLHSNGRAVVILDQSALPGETRYLQLQDEEACYHAIRSLQVRGAPAIGIFAAFALAALARQFQGEAADFLPHCRRLADYLEGARPTAVNLHKMLRRMLACAQQHQPLGLEKTLAAMEAEAQAIQAEDIAMCRAISEHGLGLLSTIESVLTHCNAGPLATSRYGTALGPVFLAKEQGRELQVYCDETRPLLQGARLTTYELQRAGVPCTLICDNMASLVMREGRVGACLVGCDRIARNGDTANKIGTSGLAILAKHYGIPFYVLGPSSTIDFSCPDGSGIPIELREGSEIREAFFRTPSTAAGVACYNPAFDVTDQSLITAIVTERGIAYPPYGESLARLFPIEFQEGKA